MVIVRPVKRSDLDDLVELAGMGGFGLTSLPQDRELLAERVAMSRASFDIAPQKPRGELYIFVMEDLNEGRVVGTSCIVSKVGGFEPFYAFRHETSVHESTHLNVRKEVSILRLVTEHSGPCEIGGLFLAPAYRKHGNGRLMSLFRFLYMAEFPERFESSIIAEMRGVVDRHGRSPFWEALGRHFFDMDFPKADYLSSVDKRFIADLMPTCPIYECLLPEEAREVIGKVHEDTRPALKMLQDEGFKHSGMVDIFEAGPIMYCQLQDIRIVKQGVRTTLEKITPHPIDSQAFVITNPIADFRACMGPVARTDAGGAIIRKSTAEALNLQVGDPVRYGPLRAAQ